MKVMAKKSGKDKELEDIKNQLKRALADYSNLQKRVEEEKKVLVKFANATLLIKFIGVLDSLEEAGKALQDEGLSLAIKKFRDTLALDGVQEIEASGKSFDPIYHEAVEVTEGVSDNKIVEVIEKGYTLNEKVLRPVKVKVSKKQASKKG
jgi:molecular chaperone GrpE